MDSGLLVRQFHAKFGFPLDRVLKDESSLSMGDRGVLSLQASSAMKNIGELLIQEAEGLRMQALNLQSGGDGRLYRAYFLLEEVGECLIKLAHKDEVGLAHELADLQYVVNGTAEQYALPLSYCFAELHRANMSKTKVGERMRTRDQPVSYQPPDMLSAIACGRQHRQELYAKWIADTTAAKSIKSASKTTVGKDTL